jgi:hypothetical protein
MVDFGSECVKMAHTNHTVQEKVFECGKLIFSCLLPGAVSNAETIQWQERYMAQ